MKKLEEEQQNLVRVNDILSELEKQVGPLERQSEKGERISEKEGRTEDLDINMFLSGERTHLKNRSGIWKKKIRSQKVSWKKQTQYDRYKAEYETY